MVEKKKTEGKINPKTKVEEELKLGPEASIINLLDYVVEHAHNIEASDVHFDACGDKIRVRFRIDGVLQDIYELPGSMLDEIISRIKILTNLRTDEHKVPQDGRYRSSLNNGEGSIDIRVSVTPTYYGESAVLRLLSDKAQQFTLESLGFNKEDSDKVAKASRNPYGMILVTGPTGSGKTTTLYTILKMLNTNDVSIITIEDPIEYAIENIKQVPVNTRTGLTFSSGLRSMLRQDPDIIMVGEIRDEDTAGLAVNTALTGHLLLSTLHTNDAATTLPRLLDMKVEPYLAASTVNVAIGQRLVRRICDECKVEKTITDAEHKSLVDALGAKAVGINRKFYKGSGCDKCNLSGYRGRVVIDEVMAIDNDIREAILNKASSSDIRNVAIKNGMVPMVEDGLKKAASGVTTISEVLRVIHE
ncbi:MAG: type II secretion system protein GspE [Candidatus Yanofskybacteria bacterium CG10_big_fil_rev_8_21_14_0_10_36_16]|uniref:Type II secretion system protein GspE n=1 Tax=Candidatus Yanofskybacteria bacterium CG10_big_fil_rev_8_21_14_0_10_36_16 TaxID=1975096 RepID=A0A2J0Q739_9BACT|nr:MAG: type II secretion system protein GspE [Candidatus Yanofskybacteria bacterium CG10_big_fil_rev_8_21_14_0_10_36_16]